MEPKGEGKGSVGPLFLYSKVTNIRSLSQIISTCYVARESEPLIYREGTVVLKKRGLGSPWGFGVYLIKKTGVVKNVHITTYRQMRQVELAEFQYSF